jgi:hypothetical protein
MLLLAALPVCLAEVSWYIPENLPPKKERKNKKRNKK